jgi:hypothetical protein
MIAKAYNVAHKYREPTKFGLGLPCSAVRLKLRRTLYEQPVNVETFRFC